MLYLSYTLTLMLFLILPAIYIVTVIFQKNILKFQRKVRDYNSKIIRSYTESLSYIKTIKALGIEDKKKKSLRLTMKNIENIICCQYLFQLFLYLQLCLSQVLESVLHLIFHQFQL